MFPIRDNIPSRSTPIVNYLVIVLCTIVFLAQLREPAQGPSLVEQFGMIPARVINPQARILIPIGTVEEPDETGELITYDQFRLAAPSAVKPWVTVITCIFLHGGWLHFLGNMWFLWIFGDNVEDRFGHFGFLLLYLGTGIAASLAHLLASATSMAPTIGASGAIAGVMGAYLILYPKARVLAIVPIFIIIQIMVIPAPVFLGLWFILQLVQGVGATGATGVAWWAHIGGFFAGMVVAWVMNLSHLLRPPVRSRLESDDPRHPFRLTPHEPRF